MTISYGHGISVSPLQVASATAALINGGIRHPASLLKHRGLEAPEGERVISVGTSDIMRNLMRLVVTKGTGKNAAVDGYRVGGKTGTAEKQVGGGYAKKLLISSFVGAFPMNDPRYVVIAMLDEPKGTENSFNYATGGWVAAPMVGRTITAMGTLLGLMPDQRTDGKDGLPRLAALSGNRRLATY
jgi:cell division protein FtsI (penicillin-binding protein 3)